MKGTHHLPILNQNAPRKARKMNSNIQFVCPVCGNIDIRSMGMLNGNTISYKSIYEGRINEQTKKKINIYKEI